MSKEIFIATGWTREQMAEALDKMSVEIAFLTSRLEEAEARLIQTEEECIETMEKLTASNRAVEERDQIIKIVGDWHDRKKNEMPLGFMDYWFQRKEAISSPADEGKAEKIVQCPDCKSYLKPDYLPDQTEDIAAHSKQDSKETL